MSFPEYVVERLAMLHEAAKEHWFANDPTKLTEGTLEHTEKFLTQLMAKDATVLDELFLTCNTNECVWFEIARTNQRRDILILMYPNGSLQFGGCDPELTFEATEWDQAIELIISMMK
jgi:hypothetical protein